MKTFLALIIIIIVVVIAGGAYYFGVHRALAPTTATSTATVGSTTTTTTSTSSSSSSYYTDTSTWQTYSSTQPALSIAYPLDFPVDENMTMAPSTDWRVNTTDSGVKLFTLTVPSAFEPQTNFANATLTVGYSQNADAVANCLVQDSNGPPAATSSTVINGVTFTVLSTSDAGAGNLYKTTSYRTVHDGVCYAVEYTVHSSQLGNYPPSYDLKQYSDAQIDDVLNRIVGTFTFL